MPEEETEFSGEKIVKELIRLGIADLFKEEDFRAACIAELKELIGTSVPMSGVLAEAAYRVIQVATGATAKLIGEIALVRTLSFLEKAPIIRGFYARLVKLGDKCLDRARLKADLMEALASARPDAAPPSPAATTQSLHMLLTQARLEDLHTATDDILCALRDSHAGLLEAIRDQFAPVLDDKRAVASAARQRIESGAQTPTLEYVATYDAFAGREQALDDLWAFMLQEGRQAGPNRFGWLAMIADGGEGKSRLALEFMKEVSLCGWRAGFLPSGELRNFTQTNVRRWRPAEPTLFIIDYPAEAGTEVAQLLLGLSQAGHEADFEYPVRLLLLERRASGRWFEKLVPKGSDGSLVLASRWQEFFSLPPLGREYLLRLMVDRLPPGAAPPPEELWQALINVDNRTRDDVPAPRALFAVATALWMAEHQGQPVSREDVLAGLLEREKDRIWFPDLNQDGAQDHLRRTHENLLAVSTMVLGTPREIFDQLLETGPLSANYLPRFALGATPPLFEPDRFLRMSGSLPQSTLGALQPDLLGEYFVLSLLKNRSPAERDNLIEWAARLTFPKDQVLDEIEVKDISAELPSQSIEDLTGGLVQFLARSFRDFPDDFDALNGLLVAGSELSSLALARALWDISYNEAQGVEPEHLDGLHRYVLKFAETFPSAASGSEDAIATALHNIGLSFRRLEQPEAAIRTYDELITRFADSEVTDIRTTVAEALFNKGGALQILERRDDAIKTYDDLINRFADNPAPKIQETVAKAMLNKGYTLATLERPEAEIKTYNELITRFADNTAPAIQEQVTNALWNKAITLGTLGRPEAEIETYDEFIARFADSESPDIQEQIARALLNKGHTLGALEGPEAEIKTYDEITTRFADSTAPGIREQVARALFNKGHALQILERRDDAIKTYDDLITRFSDSTAPDIQETVAAATYKKALDLGMLERFDDARAVLTELVAKYGDGSWPGLVEELEQAKTILAWLDEQSSDDDSSQ